MSADWTLRYVVRHPEQGVIAECELREDAEWVAAEAYPPEEAELLVIEDRDADRRG